MDATTLTRAQPGLALSRAQQLVTFCNDALVRAGCTNVRRSAMFLAQIGAESVSLNYKEEIGPMPYWAGYGGGAAYHGRTFIQITHDYNYRSFGRWCFEHHLLADPEFFVRNPAALGDDRWAWLGPVWYWTVSRPNLNLAADAADVPGATLAINGGYNNLEGRQARYNACMSLNRAILPTPRTIGKDWFDMATKADLDAVITARLNERFGWWLPRFGQLLRFGRSNKAFDTTNSGAAMVDHRGIDGDIGARLDALAKEIEAIKRKVGA
jgi:predicted chitinase